MRILLILLLVLFSVLWLFIRRPVEYQNPIEDQGSPSELELENERVPRGLPPIYQWEPGEAGKDKG